MEQNSFKLIILMGFKNRDLPVATLDIAGLNSITWRHRKHRTTFKRHPLYWYMGSDFSKIFATSTFRLDQQNIMTYDADLDYLEDGAAWVWFHQSINHSCLFVLDSVHICLLVLTVPWHDIWRREISNFTIAFTFVYLWLCTWMAKNISRVNTPKTPSSLWWRHASNI